MMKKQLIKPLLGASACAAMLFAAAPQASADSYGFYKLTNNGYPDVSSQLSVDVTDGGPGFVNFKFLNNVGIASSIADIYFDDGTLLAIASITDSGPGVAFAGPANPGNLPGANLASPPFTTTQDFSADSDSPIRFNGVNAASEWVNINFSLQGAQTFADTLNSLNDGSLRIGLHVQGIRIGTQRGSDSYINKTGGGSPDPDVPDGGSTIALLGSALLGVGFLRRKFVKA